MYDVVVIFGFQLELVCGQSWLNQLSTTIYMVGVLIGASLSGVLSDRLVYKTPTV